MRWAPMLARTINNAWCAIPLFWYTQLDGRSPRPLREAIPETQALMRWHAEHGIPVEMNESHHWSLRDAPDVVAVVAAYLAAYNARAAGVRDYVQQLMFNNPPSTSPTMDLGKMLAKLELVESLQNERFRVWRETRGGLTSYPPDPSVARGHLAATVALQMQLKPHIVHIVGHTEAHHATTAAELIEACRIADGAISQCLLGLPDMTARSRRAAKEGGTAGRRGGAARRHRPARAERPRSLHRCRHPGSRGGDRPARRSASARQRRGLRQDRHAHDRRRLPGGRSCHRATSPRNGAGRSRTGPRCPSRTHTGTPGSGSEEAAVCNLGLLTTEAQRHREGNKSILGFSSLCLGVSVVHSFPVRESEGSSHGRYSAISARNLFLSHLRFAHARLGAVDGTDSPRKTRIQLSRFRGEMEPRHGERLASASWFCQPPPR